MTNQAWSDVDSVDGDDTGRSRGARRRRGDQLHQAICQATLDELTEVGYVALRMDGVANRAKASKASLYRRWPSRTELVIDAIRYALPEFAVPPDEGDLRADLLAVLGHIAEDLHGPSGEAVRGLLPHIVGNSELMKVIRAHLVDPVIPPMLEVLRRGVVRDEIRSRALIPRVASVGPELVRMHYLFNQGPVDKAVITDIVDNVLIPLLTSGWGTATRTEPPIAH